MVSRLVSKDDDNNVNSVCFSASSHNFTIRRIIVSPNHTDTLSPHITTAQEAAAVEMATHDKTVHSLL